MQTIRSYNDSDLAGTGEAPHPTRSPKVFPKGREVWGHE